MNYKITQHKRYVTKRQVLMWQNEHNSFQAARVNDPIRLAEAVDVYSRGLTGKLEFSATVQQLDEADVAGPIVNKHGTSFYVYTLRS
jgi:hypothetical protein